MLQLHDALNDPLRKACTCAKCETRRTLAISWSTRDHVLGYFDVDKARAEAARKRPVVRSTGSIWGNP